MSQERCAAVHPRQARPRASVKTNRPPEGAAVAEAMVVVVAAVEAVPPRLRLPRPQRAEQALLPPVKMEDAVAGEMYLPGATIKFSKTPARVGEVPTPGQHTDEILGALLDYDRATLDDLRRAGAIA